jgi:hypothetical protein
MNRPALFGVIGAAALGLVVVAGGGLAYAVVTGQLPPDDSGGTPAAVATSTLPGPTPSAAAPSADATAPATGSAPIVDRMRARQPGDVLLTKTVLAQWEADHPNPNPKADPTLTKIRVEEESYETKCMWDLGYYWDPRIDMAHFRDATRGGLLGVPRPILLAYYGTNFDDAGTEYVWQNAGCNGAAIHIFDPSAE